MKKRMLVLSAAAASFALLFLTGCGERAQEHSAKYTIRANADGAADGA